MEYLHRDGQSRGRAGIGCLEPCSSRPLRSGGFLALLGALMWNAGCASPSGTEPLRPNASSSVSHPRAAEPGVLIGRVLRVDQPMEGTLVQLVAAEMFQATTGADGGFLMDGVPPGDYLLNVVDVPTVRTGIMAIKASGVRIDPGQVVEREVVFGTGVRVFGDLLGVHDPHGPPLLVCLRSPGSPPLEGAPLSDRRLQLESAKYLAGSCYARAGETYEIQDVEPGTYELEVSQVPDPSTPLTASWPAPLYKALLIVSRQDVQQSIPLRTP